MDSLVIWGAIILGAGLILLGVYLSFFSPAAARYWAIWRQAHQDYQNARGTAHLRLLRGAHARLKSDAIVHASDLRGARNRLGRLLRDRDQKLRQALERYLAYAYLDQVRGIGPTLKARILGSVFRGRLTDLKRAYTVHGVGQERQWAINQWVDHYQARLPALIKEPFPGRDPILTQYGGEQAALEARIKELTRCQADLEAQIGQISDAMEPLLGIRASHLVRAMRDPGQPSDKIDRYLQGLFAEWESAPEWFEAILAREAGDVAAR